MKLYLITLSMILSVMFTQMNHPLAMGLILLIQTTLISLISGMTSQSFWFSYILFLIFLGGMLVLFMYIISLASNEMFTLSTKLMIFSIIIMSIMILIMKMPNNLNNQEIMSSIQLTSPITLPLIKLYNQPTNIITIMLAMYLFLTLIAVVKIINIFIGPLRQMN
uniref:NADH dehydrogenase subunit 6 n=1 Tax=Paranauphoeta nigra TaxID=3035034 RepID=UPI0027A63BEF|nr:NADH dehydrogenase subunit 6 [Paranauphoeta nigra]WGO57454.1 NADH dehydrogenase subunit 6 [Paranauphoeta nigra]